MGVLDSKVSIADAAANTIEGGIRALVRGNNRAANNAEPGEDFLAAGTASIADIERLIRELQAARDYLQSEGERVRRLNARYNHLAQTASASVKIIAESLGKWRNIETISRAHPAVPDSDSPALSPDDDSGSHHELNEAQPR
jgi:hypothetical protein